MNHLFRKILRNNASIRVYSYNSGEKDILTYLSEDAVLQSRLENVRSESRQYEIAVSNFLMKREGISIERIAEGGRRVTANGFVSLSHDNNLVALYDSKVPCGVDIQRPTIQLKRIRKKFTTDVELKKTQDSGDDVALCKLWAAKEAIFKYAPFSGIRFIEDIVLDEVSDRSHWKFLLIRGTESQEVSIGFREIVDSWLAFTLID